MKNKTSYAKITAKIIFTVMAITMLFAFLYTEYMKRDAIAKLAHEDAKKTSSLVFESLYSVMQRGWTREDINEVIGRLNNVDEQMSVSIYRGSLVSQMYGTIEDDTPYYEANEHVQKAMQGQDILNISNSDYLEYYYPVKATQACLQCHSNVNSGDVLGTIKVAYPVKNLQVSLNEFINFFMIFLTLFSLIIFATIFFEFNRYLIQPIKRFSQTIKKITSSQDMSKRVAVDDNIAELDAIKTTFNTMLDSIEHQFFYDSLTGLKNRKRLTYDIDKDRNYLLLLINIDSFGEINDLYGDSIGDNILSEFAHFLQQNIPYDGDFYRLHADEFAFLSDQITDLDGFIDLLKSLSEKISKAKFTIDQKTKINLVATMGVAYGSQLLMANADTALKLAKKRKKYFLLYDDSMAMAQIYEKNIQWTKKIKQAIDTDKIVPVFQPIVDLKTQKVVKYEALMRMEEDDGSLTPPFYFLDLAKKNKLYHKLTKIMLEKSFLTFEDVESELSLNISVDDILNKEIRNYIIKVLKNSSIKERLIFEITESEGIENFHEVLEFIQEVKSYGVKISIDDFGTGYSNFEYLMKLNIDTIKIDGSIIKNITEDPNSEVVTQIIVEFAQKMQIQTIAEFVHSKEVMDKIQDLGVDYGQGFYLAKPSRMLLDKTVIE